MHSSHLCSHCLRRRILLWASAFFMTVGALGAVKATGQRRQPGVRNTPVQTASR
jgi:hypothetical protein